MQVGLSIIIPTMDRGVVFEKTLRHAYTATSNIPCEIIVVNDSKKNSFSIPDQFKDRVKIITNPKNGVASARNLGAKLSAFSSLLFLDDDIIISNKNIEDLVLTSQKYPNTAINFNWEYPDELNKRILKTQFGRYLHDNKFTSLKGWSSNLKWSDEHIFEAELIASYFLFISKDSFNLIGGYNESFPHAGAEDFDFAMRLKASGIKGLCNPLSTVLHNEEDRIDLEPWIKRKERSAETRKIAVNLGYQQMAINASSSKITFTQGLYRFKSVLFLLLKLIPNVKTFDFVYYRLINFLLTLHLYKGYFKPE